MTDGQSTKMAADDPPLWDGRGGAHGVPLFEWPPVSPYLYAGEDYVHFENLLKKGLVKNCTTWFLKSCFLHLFVLGDWSDNFATNLSQHGHYPFNCQLTSTCSQHTTSLGFVTLTIYNPMCLPIEGGTWGPPF